jgi:23S rRNA (uracil1939-C5)-methyltransferase
MRPRSHQVLDLEDCPILAPPLRRAGPAIARAIGKAAGDCDVALTLTTSGIDVAVKTMAKAKPEMLTALAAGLGVARLTLGRELVFQQGPPEVAMGAARVRVPPFSFLQATEAAEAALAGLVIDAAGRAGRIADLFCGVGPFALRLARTARVLAIDSDKPAVMALADAARRASGLKPIETRVRDLFREPLVPVELKDFDAVVFDPPRAGAEAQARELARSGVPLVIGVSCDPGTFARDAAILLAGGYRLEAVTPLDQFAWSAHVELVGIFRR